MAQDFRREVVGVALLLTNVGQAAGDLRVGFLVFQDFLNGNSKARHLRRAGHLGLQFLDAAFEIIIDVFVRDHQGDLGAAPKIIRR